MTNRQVTGKYRGLLLGWILALSLLAAYSAALHGARLAEAAGASSSPPNSAAWEVNVQFQDTTISATVLISAQVGINTFTRTVDISPTCIPQAGAVVSMSQAIMGPTGYIQCQMPNLSAQVADMTGGALILPPVASCPADGHSWGRSIMAVGSYAPGAANPLFAHPDVQYAIPFVYGGPPTLVALNLAVSGYNTYSTPFRPRAPWNAIQSDLVCDGVTCNSRHWANGAVRGTATYPAPTFTMRTYPLPIYIGYSPGSSQNLANGRVYKLSVDPGCSMVGN